MIGSPPYPERILNEKTDSLKDILAKYTAESIVGLAILSHILTLFLSDNRCALLSFPLVTSFLACRVSMLVKPFSPS